jgi:putative endonuclease
MYFVYILYSQSADRYYVGHTANIASRLESHHREDFADVKYTRKNGPWRLVYIEKDFITRGDAMKREKEIKNWKSRIKIIQLISNGGAPDFGRD